MDYSTYSNKTGCTEIEEITNGELNERYYVLKKQYENLLVTFENTKQQLHDVKRSHDSTIAVQTQLAEELENQQEKERKRLNELNNRIVSLQEDISALRQERADILELHSNEIKKFEAEILRIKEEQEIKSECQSPVKDVSELEEARAAVAAALADSLTLKSALKDAQTEVSSWRMKTEELITEVQELRAAAEHRREELRAAAEREAAAIADLAEARAMLHQCTDSQDLQSHAAKGNSIFAEVEDKRQEMAKTLLQMKQTNSRLRRELANKQAELDTLLHEKQTIWEQQTGAAAHYDRELIESYEERITQLEGLCERQRRELARWFGKLCEPTAHGWLPGVLDHFKTECERLRAEVLSRGAAQLASAAQVRDLRRKLAALTANGARLSTSPSSAQDKLKNGNTSTIGNGNVNGGKSDPASDKSNIAVTKVSVPVKSIPNVDDVKKKVSFN